MTSEQLSTSAGATRGHGTTSRKLVQALRSLDRTVLKTTLRTERMRPPQHCRLKTGTVSVMTLEAAAMSLLTCQGTAVMKTATNARSTVYNVLCCQGVDVAAGEQAHQSVVVEGVRGQCTRRLAVVVVGKPSVVVVGSRQEWSYAVGVVTSRVVMPLRVTSRVLHQPIQGGPRRQTAQLAAQAQAARVHQALDASAVNADGIAAQAGAGAGAGIGSGASPGRPGPLVGRGTAALAATGMALPAAGIGGSGAPRAATRDWWQPIRIRVRDLGDDVRKHINDAIKMDITASPAKAWQQGISSKENDARRYSFSHWLLAGLETVVTMCIDHFRKSTLTCTFALLLGSIPVGC